MDKRVSDGFDELDDGHHTYPSARHINNEDEDEDENDHGHHVDRRRRHINDDDGDEDEEGAQERAQRFRAQPRALGGWALYGGLF